MGKMQLEALLTVAAQTQRALVNEWYENGNCFIDKNNYTQKGILAEGTGLSGILLMLIAFREEPQVFSEKEKLRAQELIAVSISQLCEWTKSGFGATPLLKNRETSFFNKDFGYIDSVTWCLSVSILARYAVRNNILQLDDTTQDNITDMMTRSLSALFDAQRSDGTWGFATDPKSQKSLYFTYIAACSIADFFDYILGDIAQVEAVTEGFLQMDPVDRELLSVLDQTFGNTEQRIRDTRTKLQDYLVKDCLPLLPRIANCEMLEKSLTEKVGFTVDSEYPYHNLYYAYYLLDMMTTSGIDLYFPEILKDDVKTKQLQEYYATNNLLSEAEQAYLFQAENFANLYTSYYEQALHASRVQYMSASRTGKAFWDSIQSELPIKWEHEDSNLTKQGKDYRTRSNCATTVTDPSLIPMALRANTVYSYYVTEKPDVTVERLFDNIRSNAFQNTGEADPYCVDHLWDDQYYSLPITERSIEAIIDFYDYLCKFEAPVAEAKTAPAPLHTVTAQTSALDLAVEKKIDTYLQSEQEQAKLLAMIENKFPTSDLDLAIEKKIDAYLQSEQGQAKLLAMIENKFPTSSVPAASTTSGNRTEHIEKLTDLIELVDETHWIDEKGSDDDKLVAAFVKLFQALENCKLKQLLAGHTPKKEEDTIGDYEHRLVSHANLIRRQTTDLIFAMENALGTSNYELVRLYEYLKGKV